MPLYLFACRLNGKPDEYAKLRDCLLALKADEILPNVWVFGRVREGADELGKLLGGCLQELEGDGFLVQELAKDAAYHQLSVSGLTFKTKLNKYARWRAERALHPPLGQSKSDKDRG